MASAGPREGRRLRSLASQTDDLTEFASLRLNRAECFQQVDLLTEQRAG